MVFCHLQMVESLTLKSTLYRNKESKHHRKPTESRIKNSGMPLIALFSQINGDFGSLIRNAIETLA
jgi:hypothetical protein